MVSKKVSKRVAALAMGLSGSSPLPPQILLKPPPRFLCKARFSPVTTINKCLHRRLIFNCEMQKKHLAVRLRPDPMGELTAFPQTPELDLKGPTSKGGEDKGGEEERKGGKGDRRGKGRKGGKGRRKGREREKEGEGT